MDLFGVFVIFEVDNGLMVVSLKIFIELNLILIMVFGGDFDLILKLGMKLNEILGMWVFVILILFGVNNDVFF